MSGPGRGFVRRVSGGASERGSRYTMFIPSGYDGSKKYPLILFLHGAGETGWDGVTPSKVGLGPAIARSEDAFPFLAAFPQSTRGSWRADGPDAERALRILDEIREEFRVDAGRIHLTGISMGGYGTWSLALAHPQRWASIVPVCGGGDPSRATLIRDIPCWCFHGADDETISVEKSRVMVQALRAAGGRPIYTEFAAVGHNSWDAAYATRELFEWMLAQSR
jgi:predicted peptidase